MRQERKLQYDFSQAHHNSAFGATSRRQKAQKATAILADHIGDLSSLDALDIGCSAGYATSWYASRFRSVVAVDIDFPAVRHAANHNRAPNLDYAVMSGEQIACPDERFDVIFCMHVYEHVPNAHRLMEEIWRLLRPNGVCLFTAGNRLSWREPHYGLPLLSVIPKPIAHLYLRLLGRGNHYYEQHLTYWGLRTLVKRFKLLDYTTRVVADPERFSATDVISAGSHQQRIALALLRWVPWLCPTYLWVLRKT